MAKFRPHVAAEWSWMKLGMYNYVVAAVGRNCLSNASNALERLSNYFGVCACVCVCEQIAYRMTTSSIFLPIFTKFYMQLRNMVGSVRQTNGSRYPILEMCEF